MWASRAKVGAVGDAGASGVPSTLAPGLKGPKGLSPRVAYSKVQTADPVVPEAGSTEQRSAKPPLPNVLDESARFDEGLMSSMAPRKTLNDMLKAASEGMATSYLRAKLASDAATSPKDGMDPEPGTEKEAALDPQYVLKLAKAGRQAVDVLGKLASGELQVMEASHRPPMNDDLGHGTHQPPKAGQSGDGGETTLKTDMHNPAGGGGTQDTAQDASKKASDDRIRGLLLTKKEATQEAPKAASFGALLKAAAEERAKKAADAMSGGGTTSTGGTTLKTTDSSEAGPPAKGKDAVPATAEQAAALKPRTAKAQQKADIAPVFSERAQTSGTDPVLNNAFEHTNEAGAKISSVTRNAAGRALLGKLAAMAGGAQ